LKKPQSAVHHPLQKPKQTEEFEMSHPQAPVSNSLPEQLSHKSTEAGTDAGIGEVVLVTGISGSGKSVVLHALSDAGFFCVDNLPPELLRDFLHLERERSQRRVAIAVDVRSAGSLPHLQQVLERLRDEGATIRSVFLDASTDTLVRRFSESRRPHPLSDDDDSFGPVVAAQSTHRSSEGHRALMEAIEFERELLADLRAVSTVIDTSLLRPAQLSAWMRDLVSVQTRRMTLVFESFAFKHGVPLDADYVFDVRVLPNPYYVRELRPLNGRDEPVAAYLRSQPEVGEMLNQIDVFLSRWLPAFENDQRSYLTVAVGCTGGQHRSVYLVEALTRRFQARSTTLKRHRELDQAPSPQPLQLGPLHEGV
jgi:RNase adapter protein RapZ